MAGLFNQVQENRLQRFLIRHFNLRQGSPSPQISPEIQPTLELEPSWEQHPELLLTAGWRSFIGTITVTAGAGNSNASVRNPAGSSKLVVILQVYITTAALAQVAIQISSSVVNVVGGLISGVDPRDTSGFAVQLASGAAGGAGSASFFIPAVTIGSGNLIRVPLVLSAGFEWQFIDQTAAQNMVLSVYGMERDRHSGE